MTKKDQIVKNEKRKIIEKTIHSTLCIAEVHQWQPHFFEGDEVFFMPCGVKFTKVFLAYLNYRKVASTNMWRLGVPCRKISLSSLGNLPVAHQLTDYSPRFFAKKIHSN